MFLLHLVYVKAIDPFQKYRQETHKLQATYHSMFEIGLKGQSSIVGAPRVNDHHTVSEQREHIQARELLHLVGIGNQLSSRSTVHKLERWISLALDIAVWQVDHAVQLGSIWSRKVKHLRRFKEVANYASLRLVRQVPRWHLFGATTWRVEDTFQVLARQDHIRLRSCHPIVNNKVIRFPNSILNFATLRQAL